MKNASWPLTHPVVCIHPASCRQLLCLFPTLITVSNYCRPAKVRDTNVSPCICFLIIGWQPSSLRFPRKCKWKDNNCQGMQRCCCCRVSAKCNVLHIIFYNTWLGLDVSHVLLSYAFVKTWSVLLDQLFFPERLDIATSRTHWSEGSSSLKPPVKQLLSAPFS